jgi:hypothetical protein
MLRTLGVLTNRIKIRVLPIKGLQAKYKLSKNRRGRVMHGLQAGIVFRPAI